MYTKLKTLILLIFKCKNWWFFLMDYFNLIKKGKDIELRFWNGANIIFPSKKKDCIIASEIFICNDYVSEYLPKNNDIILDLGMNKGFYSSYILNYAKKNNIIFTLYGLEPMIDNFNYAKKNIDNNKSKKCNINLINSAIGSSNRKDKLFLSEINDGCFSMCKDSISINKNNYIDIDVLDVNEFIDKIQKIDFLKMDIEGSEYDFFNSITDTNMSKIKHMTFEFHIKSILSKQQEDFIISKLNKNNFYILFKGNLLIAKNEIHSNN